MVISTNQPIILDRNQLTKQIAKFWNKISPGWRTIWGLHIHHGYYAKGQTISPNAAQEQLIKKLAASLPLFSGCRILDAGCGMGGSSIYLAENFNAEMMGITLSPKQVQIATRLAQEKQIKNVRFKVEDALAMKSIQSNSFDIVWSLESCEQFYDKTSFLKEAHRILKPGGKLMLATWCAAQQVYQGLQAAKYKELCLAFDVPYMPAIAAYQSMLMQENFKIDLMEDWSQFVKPSWDIGISLANKYSLFKIFLMGGWRGLRFLKQLNLMREAFQTNAIQYGVFIGAKS